MNGTTVKGILFDFGGTLDTNGTHWGIVLQEAYRDAGFTLDEAAFREMYVQGERQLAARPVISDQDTFDIVLQKKLDLECAYGIAHGFLPDEPATRTRIAGIAWHCYESALENTRRAAELLRKLQTGYRLALVSNFYGNLQAVLADFNLTGCFEAVIESARVGVRKPDPAIFALALDTLHLAPSEVVVVGDSYKNDIAPALSLGIAPIWLKGRGWDENDAHRTAPHIIGDLGELADVLQNRPDAR